MATILDTITGALRLINVVQSGETPAPEDVNVAQYSLEYMIDSWSNERLLIYEIVPQQFSFVSGQQVYTLGPGGNWNTTRPIRIEDAYVTYQGNTGAQTVDLRIKPLNSSQWASIAVKQTQSTFATSYYDDGEYPLRNIYFWPVPNQAQLITLYMWMPLIDLSSGLTTQVQFPPGYERAFRYNLAVNLAPEFGKTVDPAVAAVADSSLAKLRSANAVPQVSRTDTGIAAKNRTWNWITGDTVNIPGSYGG
jgi:hypothetical protein